MLKRWLSGFIKNNKEKFYNLVSKLMIIAVIVFAAIIIMSVGKNSSEETKNVEDKIYNPKDTVIKGSDVSEEQYQKDSEIVEKFLKYCNEKKVENAYSLISDECKKNLYPSLDAFKNNYYNYIFNNKREFNMQSWVSTPNYTVYKIRYTNNMLTTGTYQADNVYEDYITLIKNENSEKISLGSFVTTIEINSTSVSNNIETKIIRKNVYLEDEGYEMVIRNNTENTILLSDLSSDDSIRLFDNSNGAYNVYLNKIFLTDLVIEPGKAKKVNLMFKKGCELSTNRESSYINFSKIIKNYEEYKKTNEYDDTFSIKVKIF